jgi:hypothetical protein
MHAEGLQAQVTAQHASGVRHVVCFEEAGECTLERVVREARAGDEVMVFGPEAWSNALRNLGLAREIPIGRVARIDSEWRLSSSWAESAPAARTVGYGAQATRLADGAAMLAGIPDGLPPRPQWPDGRRDRIRRELGIKSREQGFLVAGEPSEWIDLSFIARAVGMAKVGGAPLRLVVSPRVPRIAEIGSFLSRAAGVPPLVVDARADRPWEILPALDGAILDRDGGLERPVECAGWRSGDWQRHAWSMSPLPALWALSCGVPACVHESIDLGAHAEHPLVRQFGRDVAGLARILL